MADIEHSIASGGTTCHITAEAKDARRYAPQVPAKLKRRKAFQPCPVDSDDELFANGIFEFNITRLLALIGANPDQYPIGFIAVTDIPDYGGSEINDDTVRAVDLSRPVLLAEIAPGLYNLIDGHHRIARARRDGVPTVPAHRIAGPAHVPFLTSAVAYGKYVEYWNSKLETSQHKTASKLGGRT
jgi:hypothetical protein